MRALPYLHWWSFLSAFDAIGDGTFATVVGLRDKLRRGKKLEPWELEFYRATAPPSTCAPRRTRRPRPKNGGFWQSWARKHKERRNFWRRTFRLKKFPS